MTERAVLFGAHNGLVGIITEPAESTPRRDVAVIMSNIGMHHRVGPFRLYVELARALAATGVSVLRFDLGGMGDSLARHDAPTPAERTARDLDDAMALLTESVGAQRFVVIGLCSGVDSSHAAAKRDARVIGAAFVDGYSYKTFGHYFRWYVLRPLQRGRWERYFQRRRGARYARRSNDAAMAIYELEFPTLTQFRADVAALTRRGVRLLFVFSGGTESRVSSPRQVREMLGPVADSPHIEVEAMYEADHIFANVEKRAELVSRLQRWVASIAR